MWNEAKLGASDLDIEVKLYGGRGKAAGAKRRRWFHDDGEATADTDLSEHNDAAESPEEAYFRKSVFCVLYDNVIGELTVRFKAA